MLRKSITYTNPFTNEEVTEEHFFHISKADLVEMEMEEHNTTYIAKDGTEFTGMQAKLQRITDSEDGKAIIVEVKGFIRRSYGKKVGERFIKNPEVWAEFVSSEAYSQLVYELFTDAEAASKFMVGIVPNDLDLEAARLQARSKLNGNTQVVVPPAALQDDPPPVDRIPDLTVGVPTTRAQIDAEKARLLTRVEAEEMDGDELASGLATGRYKLS